MSTKTTDHDKPKVQQKQTLKTFWKTINQNYIKVTRTKQNKIKGTFPQSSVVTYDLEPLAQCRKFCFLYLCWAFMVPLDSCDFSPLCKDTKLK